MKYKALLVIAALINGPFSTTAVNAGGVEDIVQLNVMDGGQSKDGTYLGAIHLSLADGWKTYWRAPGDAGIPPEFNWRGSRNVGAVSFIWPAPGVFDQNGMQSIGYVDQLVLPVRVTPANPAEPVQLKGAMDLGVCQDVCIPARLKFNHTLDADATRNPAIVAALAQRPYSSREAGVSQVSCTLQPTADGFQIEAHITMPSAGSPEAAVIEPGNPAIWAAPPETSREGDTLIAKSELINQAGDPFALDRSQVRITVLGSRHAVDIQGCSAG